jgi:hypothetical protein
MMREMQSGPGTLLRGPTARESPAADYEAPTFALVAVARVIARRNLEWIATRLQRKGRQGHKDREVNGVWDRGRLWN